MRKKYVVRRNVKLEQRSMEMEQRVADIETSPLYGIALELKLEVEKRVREGVGLDSALTVAIEQERQRLLEERTRALASRLIQEALTEQKEAIEQEAMAVAQEQARMELERFQAEDAENYRQEVRQSLARKIGIRLVDQARDQIETEEQQKLLTGATAILEAHENQKEFESAVRARNKIRAKAIRQETKKTGILRYGLLLPDDEVTIGFTDKGRGFEQLTDSDGYSSAYRSHLERRRITCAVVDTDLGLFEVHKDSWTADNRKRDMAIRGGRHVRITANDPELGIQSPLIVKGAGLSIADRASGENLLSQDLDVWWTNLDDFRVLS